jgi:hypothetical protein
MAKDNQPGLKEASADRFEDRAPDRRRWQEAETWDKGHGRLEHRHMIWSPDLNDWFGKEWEGMEQVFRLERTVRMVKTGVIRHEVRYGREPPLPRQSAAATHVTTGAWALED